MTEPALPICEKLLDAAEHQCGNRVDADVLESAACLIEALYEALVMARQYVLEHSDDDGEVEQIDAALTLAREGATHDQQ